MISIFSIFISFVKQSENPEHTKWKWERIADAERRDVAEQLYTQLKNKIHDIIVNSLKSPNTAQTDAEGAGEYLPEKSEEEKEKPTEKLGKILKAPKISKPKKTKSSEIKTYDEDPEGNGVGLDMGEAAEIPFEEFMNSSGQNNAKEGEFSGDDSENGKRDFDGTEKFVRNKMSGTKYRFFCRNKNEGLYSLVFRAPETADDAELELSVVDGAGSKESLNVVEAFRFGDPLKIKKHKTIKLSFAEGDIVDIQLKISKNELVSVEVNLYAIW